MLTEAQRSQYEEQGYLILPHLFTREEMEAASAECERFQAMVADWEESSGDFNLEAPGGGFFGMQGGVKSYKGVLRKVHNVIAHSALFKSFSEDPRITELMQAIIGPRLQVTTTVLWFKPSRVGSVKPWHQELAYFTERGLIETSIWIAIDPATKENGCMQFIPGSHKFGLIPHDGDELQLDEQRVDVSKAIYCELEPGSAVMFHSLILHKTAENLSDKPRRSFTFQYNRPA